MRWHKWQLVADLCRYGQHRWAYDRDACADCGVTSNELARFGDHPELLAMRRTFEVVRELWQDRQVIG